MTTELDKSISELILDLTAQAVFAVDTKGICTYANAACLKLLGYQQLDDLLGKDMHRILHGDTDDANSLCVPQDCVIHAGLKNCARLRLENMPLSHCEGFACAATYLSEPLYNNNGKIGSVVTLIEIDGKVLANQQISGRDKRLRAQQAAMLSLAKYHATVDGDLTSVLRAAVETSSKTLNIARVGIWVFDNNHSKINCINLYTKSNDQHASGAELAENDFPNYFKALHENRVIVADVAHENPATQEFSSDYFPKHGIFSMLDAPIWRGSEVIGVVCYEHTDSLRKWTPDEQNFASSVADMVSLAMELWHHKQAKQALAVSEARFSGIIKIAADAIISVDETHQIVLFNQGAENIFGYSQDEVIGKNIAILLPDDVKHKHQEHIKNFVNSPKITSKMGDGRVLYGLRKDGEKFPVESTISKLTLGNRTLLTVAMRDITERLRKDDELREYRSHLEDLVNERTRELARVRDEALQASKAKSTFLANMSHELRTPLNSIIGFTGILMDEITGPVNEQQQKQLNIVYDSANHLLDLIKGVLDLSKIEAGKFDVNNTRFSVAPLLQELIDLMLPQSRQKGLSLQLEIPEKTVFVCTDKSKLRQILLNLISNAVKFTLSGDIIIIRLRLEANNAYFEIQDDGIGIPPDHIERIFEAFYQDKDTQKSREIEGTGLGLAICKHFAELMGGSISVNSDTNGTIFCVCLPNTIVECAPTEIGDNIKGIQVIPPKNRRVLIIDDDDHAVDLLVNYLEREGYETHAIDNTEDIVEIARDYKPFAITLDLLMPNRSGWSVLTLLKTDSVTATIPVMIISIIDEQKLGLTLGAIDYVQKPIDQQRLLSGLQALRVQGRDILIIEDDEHAMQFLCVLLQQANYRVRIARSGSDGITEVERMPPDIILLDLMMQGMSGFEFIRYIKTNKRTREIPIIVTSAKELTQGEADYLREHAEEIMHKGSFGHKEILDMVGKTLTRWSR
ncbi:MAG: response regulator [Gammaproteobacteria bacterium]|nr:response regulator [Gammaproteobacteria bacterium]